MIAVSLEMYFAALNDKLMAIFKKGNGGRGTGNEGCELGNGE